jgi:D-arabinose 5-phosphate isomerase GutQ/beta-phosphoglucomutase-like phosphatase (HAD superfamily)
MFDLDGTIINSEPFHYLSYNNLLKDPISYAEYQRIFHSELKGPFIEANNINKLVKEQMFSDNYLPEYVKGADIFIEKLIQLGKDIIIVTNSSDARVEFIKKCHPLLRMVDKWYTGSSSLAVKPHSDLYIKAITESGASLHDVVIFEDSLTGYLAVRDLSVAKIFICNKEYYYYNKIQSNKIDDYTQISCGIESSAGKLQDGITKRVGVYIDSLTEIRSQLEGSIEILYNLLKDKINKTNIYFLGVGKSGNVCHKIVSTWSSLGINVLTNNVEELFHGEFGKFKDGDIVVYISNSGNTTELINVAKHFNKHFKILQVSLSFNKECALKEHVNINISMAHTFKEACHLNTAPTTSSVLFMILLDTVGSLLSENIVSLKIEEFKKYHPGGSLGFKKPIDNLIICASGKGTRLYHLTKYIPKYLVNIDNSSILIHIIKYWEKYTDNIILIIEEKYNDISEYYLKQCNVKYKIKNVVIDKEENAYTLYNALGDEFNNTRVLITWCDIFPAVDIDHSVFKGNIIFTHGSNCRYKFTNTIVKEDGGNIVGLFFFENFVSMNYENLKQDICDLIPTYYPSIKSYDIKTLVDVGDMDKLLSFQKNNNIYTTRYFNQITDIGNGLLKKESIHPNGDILIKREMKYYKAIHNYNLPFPKIHDYGDKYFILDKIEGVSLSESNLPILLEALKKLHSIESVEVSEDVFINDLSIEFNTKIKDRLLKIKPIILYFQNIKYVNSIQIIYDTKYIINDLYKRIYNNLIGSKQRYTLIHGDCQFSNTMLKDGTVIFIDPRGYFGKTFLFGNENYDFSKVLYALSGYDTFNSRHNYSFDIDNNNLILDFVENLQKYEQIFTANGIDWNTCLYMCVLHWFGLSEYISNNILKSSAAYYYAIYLYHTVVLNS